ncbi:MAG TPA: phosphatidate cytidylyltransferase [Syntrophorhabdaceae bacterium]|nr:phosphatidate cytidylyltransferase [Syntrophorhabdaceae bacterium]
MGELRKRIVAGCILAPVVTAIFYFFPPVAFLVFLAIVILLAVRELAAMTGTSQSYLIVFLSLPGIIPLYLKQYPVFALWLLLSPFLYLLLKFFQRSNQSVNTELVKGVCLIVVSQVFIVIPFFSFYVLKVINNSLPLMLIFAVWASDICAFVAGKNFGKTPFAPMISPKKTYEGFLGSLVGSSIITVLFHPLIGFSVAQAVGLGLLIGLFGQAGDLLESSVKRVSAIKDSSSLIPGHGGILDRVDSFVLTAPLLLCFVWKA